jgi:hypothetical protein
LGFRLTPVRRAVRVRGMIFLRADGIGILLGWAVFNSGAFHAAGKEVIILRSISITVSYQENNVLRD